MPWKKQIPHPASGKTAYLESKNTNIFLVRKGYQEAGPKRQNSK